MELQNQHTVARGALKYCYFSHRLFSKWECNFPFASKTDKEGFDNEGLQSTSETLPFVNALQHEQVQ